MKNSRPIIIHILEIAIVVIIVPICLNYVLQISLPGDLPIIGNVDGAPVIWLSFWGSYLAAIGSLYVARVAIKDNKQLRQQVLLKVELEAKRTDYDIFESFILENERIHSIGNFTSIIKLLGEESQREKADIAQKEWFSLLQSSSLKIVRFNDETEYQKALEIVNNECLNLAIEIKELLEKHDKIALSSFNYKPYDDSYAKLIKVGQECLIIRKKAIDNKYEQLKATSN